MTATKTRVKAKAKAAPTPPAEVQAALTLLHQRSGMLSAYVATAEAWNLWTAAATGTERNGGEECRFPGTSAAVIMVMADVERLAEALGLETRWTSAWSDQRIVWLREAGQDITDTPLSLATAGQLLQMRLRDLTAEEAAQVLERLGWRAAAAFEPPRRWGMHQRQPVYYVGQLDDSELIIAAQLLVYHQIDAAQLRDEIAAEQSEQARVEARQPTNLSAQLERIAERQDAEEAAQAPTPARPQPTELDPELRRRVESLGGIVKAGKVAGGKTHYQIDWGGAWNGKDHLPRLFLPERLAELVERLETEKAATAAATPEQPAAAPPPLLPEVPEDLAGWRWELSAEGLRLTCPERAGATAWYNIDRESGAIVEARQIERDREVEEQAEQPAPAAEDPARRRIVDTVLYIEDQNHPYRLASVQRLPIEYHTAEKVRIAGSTVRDQDRVYCIPDDAAWQLVVEARAQLQRDLDALADGLRALGSYSLRLAEAGRQAPNPLSPTVIAAADPDHDYGHGLSQSPVPRVERVEVERHTPLMLKTVGQGVGGMCGQGDHFVCLSDDAWTGIVALRAAVQETAAYQQDLLAALGTYRAARADGRYDNGARPALPSREDWTQAQRGDDDEERPVTPESTTGSSEVSPRGTLPREVLVARLEAYTHTLPAVVDLDTQFACPPDLPERMEVPRDLVVPGRYQPRVEFDEGDLESLAESIREEGILTALKVHINEKGRLELIAGERRWRAAERASKEFVPVEICTYTLRQIAIIALIDNLERKGLTAAEEGRSYERLIKDLGLSEMALSKRIKRPRSYIQQRRALATAAPEILQAQATDRISFTLARAICAGAGRNHPAQRKALQDLLSRPTWMGKATEEDARKYGEDAVLATAGESLAELGWSVCRTNLADKQVVIIYGPAERPQIVSAAQISAILEDEQRPKQGEPIAPAKLSAEDVEILKRRELKINTELVAPWSIEMVKKVRFFDAGELEKVLIKARQEVRALEERFAKQGVVLKWRQSGGASVTKGRINETASNWSQLCALAKRAENGELTGGATGPGSRTEATCERCGAATTYAASKHQSFEKDGKHEYGRVCLACQDELQAAMEAAKEAIRVAMEPELTEWLEVSPRGFLALLLTTQRVAVPSLGLTGHEMHNVRCKELLPADPSVLRSALMSLLVNIAYEQKVTIKRPERSKQNEEQTPDPLAQLEQRLTAVGITLDTYDNGDPQGDTALATTAQGILQELAEVQQGLRELGTGQALLGLSTQLHGQLMDLLTDRLEGIWQWYEQQEAAEAAEIVARADEVRTILACISGQEEDLIHDVRGLLTSLEAWARNASPAGLRSETAVGEAGDE